MNLICDSYYQSSAPQATHMCGSFWWRDVLKLYENFCKLAIPQVHAGDTVVFWLDKWEISGNLVILKDRFPRLHSFVIDDLATVKDFLELPNLTECFHLPLSLEAFQELDHLQSMLLPIELDPNSKDIWRWPSKSGQFQTKIYYDYAFSSIVVDPIFKWIWKCSCTLKVRVFGWLLLMDRLNTRDMMQRRHWIIQDDCCVLCQSQTHEDRIHLFFTCNLSQRVWNYLGISWQVQPHQSTYSMASSARDEFGLPFFTKVVFTATWNIWTQRNGKIFRNETPSFRAWRRNFVHDLTLLTHRIKCKYRDKLLDWLASLP